MQAYGGVSIVNALPSWYGSSMAINLKVKVEIREGKRVYSQESELIKTILNYFKEKYSIPDIEVDIESELPQKSGLKSSSAVSVALIAEIAKQYDLRNINPPILSAILSLKAGVSYTGALDDAVASYCGGIAFTYNKMFRIVKLENLEDNLSILILAKGGRQKPVNLNELRKYSHVFEEIFKIALKDYLTAMKMNGILIANILGYSLEPIEIALKKGALAAGISGNGPSYFAVSKNGEEGPIYESLKKFGDVIIVRPVSLDCKDLSIKD
ncbi:shikimate kinase [Saccharolobus solfataricus]|nr:shikimate kinase [Saccharolobus solfataricus]AKA73620.1 shikimate kinase [Saccharolobus solfataricus]AKA76318.1 shikimate kinase [Saccharolobus solfataricus]AKA79010.1 shikimate kinase [Saccharolobus solfataricus]AZF68089.1 shikimate kinase [Saccharolobus solfataricus]AZF70709.1 shikimate kinase [Saccharolobus solfataricus]